MGRGNGSELGNSLGALVGGLVGEEVGTFDGTRVGHALGVFVGVPVGRLLIVGSDVGGDLRVTAFSRGDGANPAASARPPRGRQ